MLNNEIIKTGERLEAAISNKGFKIRSNRMTIKETTEQLEKLLNKKYNSNIIFSYDPGRTTETNHFNNTIIIDVEYIFYDVINIYNIIDNNTKKSIASFNSIINLIAYLDFINKNSLSTEKQYINREQFNNLDAIFSGCYCLNFRGYSKEDNNQIKDCLHWNFKDLAQLKTSSNIINTVIQAAKVKTNKNLYLIQILNNNNIYLK